MKGSSCIPFMLYTIGYTCCLFPYTPASFSPVLCPIMKHNYLKIREKKFMPFWYLFCILFVYYWAGAVRNPPDYTHLGSISSSLTTGNSDT